MRKVKLSMQMTINGYVGGPNGENDWMTWNPDEEFLAFLSSVFESSDTIVIGRKLATSGFIEFWEETAKQNPAHPFAKKIVDTQKIVFSKTLDQPKWNNTRLAKGNLAEEIDKLKNQKGKDILVIGGAGFASSMIDEGLVNEYHLIINPTAMPGGMTIFSSLDGIAKFEPVGAKLYPGGKTVLTYQPKHDQYDYRKIHPAGID